MFSILSLSILMLFTDNKRFDPRGATLVFIPFEISKHPAFAQCLIQNALEPTDYNLKWMNYIKR